MVRGNLEPKLSSPQLSDSSYFVSGLGRVGLVSNVHKAIASFRTAKKVLAVVKHHLIHASSHRNAYGQGWIAASLYFIAGLEVITVCRSGIPVKIRSS